MERRNKYKQSQHENKLNNFSNRKKRNGSFNYTNTDKHQDVTPPQSNISSKRDFSKGMDSTLAVNVEHENYSKNNNLSATDFEKGWIIHICASAHMTPFKQHYEHLENTYRKIIPN